LGLQCVLALISEAVTFSEIRDAFSKKKEGGLAEPLKKKEAEAENGKAAESAKDLGFSTEQGHNGCMVMKEFKLHNVTYPPGCRGEVLRFDDKEPNVLWVQFWSCKKKRLSDLSDKDKKNDQLYRQGISKEEGLVGQRVKYSHVKKMKSQLQLERQIKMKCWAVLFGHITGFAMINAFATLQISFIKMCTNPSMIREELVLWSAHGFEYQLAMGLFSMILPYGLLKVLFKAFHQIREKINLADDGRLDDKEELWVEETTETEDDVMGLTVSFVIVQVLRFLTTGIFPNEEGEVEGEWEQQKQYLPTYQRGLQLFAVGILLYMAHMLRQLFCKKHCKECHGKGKRNNGEKCSNCKGTGQTKVFKCDARTEEQVTIVLGMVFSWCVFFGAGWTVDLCLRGSLQFKAGDESTATMSSVLVAGVILGWAFSMIFILDKLADQTWTDKEVDKSLRGLNKALGILIGFAWERSFDASVVRMANSTSMFSPAVTKLILSLLLCAIVVPAWRQFILPELQRLMVFEEEDEEAEEEAMEAGEMQGLQGDNDSDEENKPPETEDEPTQKYEQKHHLRDETKKQLKDLHYVLAKAAEAGHRFEKQADHVKTCVATERNTVNSIVKLTKIP
jgi:hypothetical protein